MQKTRPAPLRQGLAPACAAILVPVAVGLAFMALAGAPADYLLLNAVAAALAVALIALGLGPAGNRPAMIAWSVALVALLFLPPLTGPVVNGVARWLPLGPLALNAGLLCIPALAVLASRLEDYSAPILLAALLAVSLQPDAAAGFAVSLAAAGLYHARGDWKLGIVALAGFLASLPMALEGELASQPFVERIIPELALAGEWLTALGLLLALVAGFVLIAAAAPLARAERLALAGSLFGFGAMALISNYPTPLIGHGAAPIIGYGLALGLWRTAQ